MNDEEKEMYFGGHQPEDVDYEIIEVDNPTQVCVPKWKLDHNSNNHMENNIVQKDRIHYALVSTFFLTWIIILNISLEKAELWVDL